MQRARVIRHIERNFTQNFYTGYVEILNTTLHYTISFPQGMDWFLEDDGKEASISEVKEHFLIAVKNGTQDVPLEDDEYLAFFQLVGDLAIEFELSQDMQRSKGSLLVKLAIGLGARSEAVSHHVATLEAEERFFDIFKREKFRN